MDWHGFLRVALSGFEKLSQLPKARKLPFCLKLDGFCRFFPHYASNDSGRNLVEIVIGFIFALWYLISFESFGRSVLL